MTYTSKWFEESQILLTEMSGEISTEDARKLLADTADMMLQSTAKRVYHLMDMSQVQKFTLNLLQIPDQMRQTPPNLAWSIIVLSTDQSSLAIRAVANSVLRLIPLKLAFFYSRDEALSHIHQLIHQNE